MGINIEFVKKCYNNKKRIDSYLDYFNSGIDFGISYPERKLIQKYFKQDSNILDIGCGVGRVEFALSNLGYKKITGIDISEGMINEAEKINNTLGKNINFKIENVMELSFGDNEYESAIAFHAITPIPEVKNRYKALKEIYRVLRPGGNLIISTFLREMRTDGFWEDEIAKWKSNLQDKRLYEFGDIISNNEGVEVFIHIPNRTEFANLLKSAGFTVTTEYVWSDLMNTDEEVTEAQKCKYWVAKK